VFIGFQSLNCALDQISSPARLAWLRNDIKGAIIISYSIAMREIGYREAMLVYIDILGFRKIIEKSATDPHVIPPILSILQDLKKQTSEGGRVVHEKGKEKPVWIFRGFNFSDLTIRATVIDTTTNYVDVLKWEFLYLASIQAHHLCYGDFLLRGAISNGPISMEPDKSIPDDIIFGPALVRSYELERDKANYPRIIIDFDVLGKADQSDETLWPNYFHKDADDEFFIDYLFAAATDDLLGQPGHPLSVSKVLQLHKDNTEKKINKMVERDEKILDKLRWVVSYHNDAVQRLKQYYEQDANPYDILDRHPIQVPDSLKIDTALLDTV
jgi:hypothetical protein